MLDQIKGSPSAWFPEALTAEECTELLELVANVRPNGIDSDTSPFPTFRRLPHQDLASVDRVKGLLLDVNAARWDLPVDGWSCTVSRYTVGQHFPPHLDYDPSYPDDAPAITFAASVLIVEPETFGGGQVTVGDRRIPRAQGSAALFHAFVSHRVARVTAGERWALNVFGTVGKMPDARRIGWPERWVFERERTTTSGRRTRP